MFPLDATGMKLNFSAGSKLVGIELKVLAYRHLFPTKVSWSICTGGWFLVFMLSLNTCEDSANWSADVWEVNSKRGSALRAADQCVCCCSVYTEHKQSPEPPAHKMKISLTGKTKFGHGASSRRVCQRFNRALDFKAIRKHCVFFSYAV